LNQYVGGHVVLKALTKFILARFLLTRNNSVIGGSRVEVPRWPATVILLFVQIGQELLLAEYPRGKE
jgi:hypothetical protein